MIINTTAVTWYFAAMVSVWMAYRFFVGSKKIKNFLASYFSLFFLFSAISFLFLGSSWISPDSLYLKIILFLGHLFLWFSFAVLGEIAWRIKLNQPVYKWIPPVLILMAGSFELYLEWNCVQSPRVVQLSNLFSVTQVQLCFSDFIALTTIVLFLSTTMGIIFFKEALKIKDNTRIKAIGIGITFFLASTAGALTTLEQPPLFLVIEDFIVIIGFSLIFAINHFFKSKENA